VESFKLFPVNFKLACRRCRSKIGRSSEEKCERGIHLQIQTGFVKVDVTFAFLGRTELPTLVGYPKIKYVLIWLNKRAMAKYAAQM
jgi:hypothetical protein